MRIALWTIYIGFLVAGLRRFLKESHTRMSFHWALRAYGDGYSTVRAALTFTVTYSHMRNGMRVHSITHIARLRVREFRYKGDMPSRILLQLVANEMHLRTRVDHGKIFSYDVVSYDVVLVNLYDAHLFAHSDESNIPKDVIAEVDRIEDIFMSLPRTIK